MGKMTFDSHFILWIESNLKWTTDLNGKAKTKNLLDQNITEYLCDLGVGKELLGHRKD